MENTSKLKLPYIMSAQAQKHVTHNESLRTLDILVQSTVKTTSQSTPPSNLTDGDSYIVGPSPTGAWETHTNSIARWHDATWEFHAPQTGWRVWDEEESLFLIFFDDIWQNMFEALSIFDQLGVNATADEVNRLAVSGDASLFNHNADDHRLKINKAADSDTASVVFQSGFQGHAEIGLTGDQNLRLNVSSESAIWYEAMVANAADGSVSFPNSTFVSDAAVNLLQDSGRFCPTTSSVSIGAFKSPAYLQQFNGTTFTGHSKFINNNADHGGTAGNLDLAALSLIEKLKHPAYRRNGLEFNIAVMTMGSGTNYSVTHDGVSYHLSMGFKQSARMATATVRFYAQATTGNLFFRTFAGQKLYFDGVLQSNNGILSPQDGWTAVCVVDKVNPRESWGYTPSHISLYQADVNDEALIACMALMAGEVPASDDVGVIPSLLSWSA